MKRHLTFANIVSMLALFIALGGISWAAATLPKNSVGTKQLKKNAVNNSDIKKSAVTGSKVKSNTLTGSDIKESTLSQVPSAASAASADSASSVTSDIPPTLKRVGSSASNADFDTARIAAAAVPLASNGHVSVYGKCFLVGTDLYAIIFAGTDSDGTLMSSGSGVLYYGSPWMSSSTVEMSRYLTPPMTAGPNSTSPMVLSSGMGLFTLFGPDGVGLTGMVAGAAKRGVPPTGNGPYGDGDVCLFQIDGKKLSVS